MVRHNGRASQVVQWLIIHLQVKEMQEVSVSSLDQEDPLEKEMTTHCRILARELPWTEEPGRLPSMGPYRVRHDSVTKHAHTRSKGQLS